MNGCGVPAIDLAFKAKQRRLRAKEVTLFEKVSLLGILVLDFT